MQTNPNSGELAPLKAYPVGIQKPTISNGPLEDFNKMGPVALSPVTNGAMTPINGLINGFPWGYNLASRGSFTPFVSGSGAHLEHVFFTF